MVTVPGKGSRRARDFESLVACFGQIFRRAGAEPGRDQGFIAHLRALGLGEGSPLDERRAALRLHTAMLFPYGNPLGGAAWTLLFLLAHPDELGTVMREHRRCLGRARRLRPLGYDDVKRLERLGDALRETLRLTLPVAVRKAMRDLEYGDEFVIPAGHLLADTTHFVHRDPKLFPDPERFDPGRFRRAASAQLANRSLLVFGAGAHPCLGRHFAMLQMKTVLATVLRRLELSMEPWLAAGLRDGSVRVGSAMWRPSARCTVHYRRSDGLSRVARRPR
jgi:cytochrome P450